MKKITQLVTAQPFPGSRYRWLTLETNKQDNGPPKGSKGPPQGSAAPQPTTKLL